MLNPQSTDLKKYNCTYFYLRNNKKIYAYKEETTRIHLYNTV